MFWIALGCTVVMFIIYGIFDSIKAKKYKEKSEQNKSFAEQILSQTALYESEKTIRSLMNSNSSAKSLVEAGALLVFCTAGKPRIAITKNCGVCSSDAIESSPFIHPDNLTLSMKKFEYNNSVTITKKASTTGRAIAGGLIAGEVGAVIGAASAISANASGGVQKNYGGKAEGYRLIIHQSEFRHVYISKELVPDTGVPTYSDFSVSDRGSYYEIIGPFVESKTDREKESLCKYKDYFTNLINEALHADAIKAFPKQAVAATCDMCEKQGVPVTKCEIKDEMGTRYRFLCEDCLRKYNAKVIVKQ